MSSINCRLTENLREHYTTGMGGMSRLIFAEAWHLHTKRLYGWEPAAGEGDMAGVLQTYFETVYTTDILDGTDFLKSSIDTADWIITNPPFSLAEAFIRRASELGKPFAFLVKSQFWHAKRRLSLFDEFPPSYILPLTWRPDFFFKDDHGGSPLMDVMWCVWLMPHIKGTQTVYRPLERPKNVAETLNGGKSNGEDRSGLVS